MPDKPAYNLVEFVTCCDKNPEEVYMIGNALRDARNIFHLHTEPDVLKFIANNGLENVSFINSSLWRKNPDPVVEIFIDAYEFMTGGILGYIAFFKNIKGKWVIKSFHQSNERGGIMEAALKKAKEKGFIK
ncbi:MAG: hypothetical protein LBH92_08270 [Bacteroidales bacterium]|jgi:hypothetical protein|nr:hypothetical protein [Bacteroidales bacterium]